LRHHKDDLQYMERYVALLRTENKTPHQENTLRHLRNLEIIQAAIGNAVDQLDRQTEAISALIVYMIHDVA